MRTDESAVNRFEEQMQLFILWLLCVGGLLTAASLFILELPNNTLSLMIIAVWELCALSAIAFKKIRQRLLTLLAILITLAFPFIILVNGVVPASLAPLFVVVLVLVLKGQTRIICMCILNITPLMLLANGEPQTTAIVVRVVFSTIVLSILIYYLLSSYQALVDKTQLQLDTNERIYGVIGHELRTPAATIKMLIDIELEQNCSKNILELQRLSSHLLCVLDDMKTSSSSATLAVYKNNETISVHDTVERAIEGVKPLAEKYNFIINFSAKRAVTEHHIGSTKAIFQIIQNLIKNAILHSGGSTVTVMKSAESLSHDKTHYRINVIDDGKGIDVKFRDKMFNAFERGDTLSEGTGLGLNICKQIANTLEDGDLSYISSENGGANFELVFVLHSVDEHDAVSVKVDDFELLQNLKILLVEDTPMLRMIASKILTQNGAIVTEAEDGIIGLNQASTGDFDLVITDIMMPNCDGYELTVRLREQGFVNPIIGVTGATVGSEAERLIACGANAVLPKPLTLLSITEELKKLKANKA